VRVQQRLEYADMWDIVGHGRVVEMLQRAIESASLPHALILAGPAGVGKTKLAMEIAMALNCVGEEPPCQQCLHCHQIAAGSHPDVSVIEKQDGKTGILIEQVRVLRDAASLRPYQGRQKVYIIAGSEDLTAQASDALLKTLEEPQPQVTLILTASDAESLSSTVLSRCRLVTMRGVDSEEIVRLLEREGVAETEAGRIANLARGSVGWALRAARQPKLMAQQEQSLEQLCGLLDLPLDARLQLAETLTADRKDRAAVRRNIGLLALLGRDLLLVAHGLAPVLVMGEQQETVRRQATRLGAARIVLYLQRLRLTMERIDRNVDPRLALEALMVNLP
jgi:DNA polymerase-3 subunit delta'